MVLLKELFEKAMKDANQPKRGKGIPSQKTGVRNVFLMNCPRCKKGFMFQYRFSGEDGKRKTIQSVNLQILEARVKRQDLEWIVDDEPLMRKTIDKVKRGVI